MNFIIYTPSCSDSLIFLEVLIDRMLREKSKENSKRIPFDTSVDIVGKLMTLPIKVHS